MGSLVVMQVQDPALGLVEAHTIGFSQSIQPVQILWEGFPILQHTDTPSQLGVICKLTELALDPHIQTINKDIQWDWPQNNPGKHYLCYQIYLTPFTSLFEPNHKFFT